MPDIKYSNGCVRKSIVRNAQTFTLIEMLVVIAIISILASMIMPVLHNSIEVAKGVLCINNMKNWGIINSQYSNQFNGSIIPASCARTDMTMNISWNEYSGWIRGEYLPDVSYNEYRKGLSINGCPAHLEGIIAINDKDSKYFSYGTNYLVSNPPLNNMIAYRIAQIKKPGKTILITDLADYKDDGTLMNASGYRYDTVQKSRVGAIHNGTSSCLFLDGHSELRAVLTLEDFTNN